MPISAARLRESRVFPNTTGTRSPEIRLKTYPNLLLAGVRITGPMECIVSDMTAFYVKGTYYELTLYMDLWNDELIAHALYPGAATV